MISAGPCSLGTATTCLSTYTGWPIQVLQADMQSGYERAINALVPALAGADELSGVGEMAGGVCSCNEQMVIDNDIYGHGAACAARLYCG